ncbi:hypothetical protein CEXT_124151 [Caerostris extrusa]|uniref:Uncharacterized protein n=1 Tax=Caerostris extrusa TaxID=172846 RepID=A0AAV4MJ97_CAEEX|nr:hypothetical protein CEXT_124151 [Caerostris extrusa]
MAAVVVYEAYDRGTDSVINQQRHQAPILWGLQYINNPPLRPYPTLFSNFSSRHCRGGAGDSGGGGKVDNTRATRERGNFAPGPRVSEWSECVVCVPFKWKSSPC